MARLAALLAKQRAKPENAAFREALRRATWIRPDDRRPVFR